MNWQEPETIDYEDAIQFKSLVQTSTQSQKELTSKINDLVTKNSQLEKEKQSAILDYTLLKVCKKKKWWKKWIKM